jgi:alkanesulfonate monooxygenase SsuD/methylene tetrahydromethanopterin reductase-like flavin-dependent oxidoreductase (luciferase family)
MGQPETMAGPFARIDAACREVGRDPATLGITALIGLWFPDLLKEKPGFAANGLAGTAQEIAVAMRGYAELGVQHIMFQFAPYTRAARERITEALQLYRAMPQHAEP